jgi:CheY-like chemotaxis protein
VQILLVDDDLPSREALSELLQLAGHRVVSAENGKVALERLRKNDGYCVILLDVMMPVMDGFEFRHQQLQDERLASIPVIVVTADGRAREKARQLRTDRFLQKPISPAELLRAVNEYCPAEGGVC